VKHLSEATPFAPLCKAARKTESAQRFALQTVNCNKMRIRHRCVLLSSRLMTLSNTDRQCCGRFFLWKIPPFFSTWFFILWRTHIFLWGVRCIFALGFFLSFLRKFTRRFSPAVYPEITLLVYCRIQCRPDFKMSLTETPCAFCTKCHAYIAREGVQTGTGA